MAKLKFQTLRGMIDILPEEQKYWQFVLNIVEDFFQRAGYGKITTPLLEKADLFVKGTGLGSDIVNKEMYVFKDKSGEKVALKPENTPNVARAYLEHGMYTWPQPVKLYYIDPIFRYDRPQAGRYRQFWQYGAEVIGDKGAFLDAEVILLSWRILESLGLSNLSLEINSIGCSKCRQKFIIQLINYYQKKKKALCALCKERLKRNPLRLLDCKELGCAPFKETAPQILDALCSECSEHFKEVLEYLDELEIPYNLNPYLVRGLDYYTKTVFEIWDEKNRAQNALGGGGRYDRLIELLGGKPTPAVGMAFGVERVIAYLKEQGLRPKEELSALVFVAQLGEEARKKSLFLVDQLWGAGIRAQTALSKESVKAQLKMADKLGAPIALIIGQKEVTDKTVIIRDMNSGIQTTVEMKDIISELKKRLPS